jgi:uncharacterized membrane protein
MKMTFESFVFRLTTLVIVLGFLTMVVGFVGEEIMVNEGLVNMAIEVIDWVNLLFAVCIVLGWIVAFRYFQGRAKEPNSPADWVLLLCGLLVPPSAIYILRYLRKRDGGVSEPSEKQRGQ